MALVRAAATAQDERVDLRPVIRRCDVRCKELARMVSVTPRTDVAADQEIDVGSLATEIADEGHGITVDAVDASPGIEVRLGADVDAATVTRLDGGLVVGADGVGSVVRATLAFDADSCS